MGLSLANTMALYTGRGEPMTVIKGGFALGLVNSSTSLWYFAPSIRFDGLATSSTSGFRYEISGRHDLGDFVSSDHLASISLPSYVSSSADYDGFVRLTNITPVRGDYLPSEEELAHTDCPAIGTLVAPLVQIKIYGKLDSLSIGKIREAGVSGSTVTTGSNIGNTYLYRWPNGQRRNGWRTFEVHVYDNPQLKDHITGISNSNVFWDC